MTPPAPGGEHGPDVGTKQTAWDSSGGVSRAERSAAAMLDAEVLDDSGVRLSSPLFYTLIAVAFAFIIGAWTVGYQRGSIAGKKAIEPYVRDQPVVRPIQGESDSSPDSAQNTSPSTTTPPDDRSNTQPMTTPIPVGSGILSPTGFLSSDPRLPGNNYLVLATLSTQQAADAISFMQSNSVEIIGVPVVDSGASSANNPSRYTLYSLGVAIPSNQWNAVSVERSQHQLLIAQLGARWQRERRGGSDFSQEKTNWEKYTP